MVAPANEPDPGEKAIKDILGDYKLPVWDPDRNLFVPAWNEESIALANRIIKNTQEELVKSKEQHD